MRLMRTRRIKVVASESTNTTGTQSKGNGRVIAYGLIALAVVLFGLAYADGYGKLAIAPMDQFRSRRCLVVIPSLGTRRPM